MADGYLDPQVFLPDDEEVEGVHLPSAAMLDIDPELIKNMIKLGLIPGQQEATSAEALRAQALQDIQTPAGTTVGSRNTYVAASPLEHLGVGLARYSGQQREKAADKRAEALRNAQEQGRLEFFSKYFRGQ